MALAFSYAVKNDLLDDLATLFPAGAVLEFRTGAAPGVASAASGTLIASITLPATPWNSASSGSKTKNGTWQDATADNTGTIGHFRLRTSGDANGADGSQTNARIEGSVTATGGGGDLTVDNTSVNAGQPVTITAFTFSI